MFFGMSTHWMILSSPPKKKFPDLNKGQKRIFLIFRDFGKNRNKAKKSKYLIQIDDFWHEYLLGNPLSPLKRKMILDQNKGPNEFLYVSNFLF